MKISFFCLLNLILFSCTFENNEVVKKKDINTKSFTIPLKIYNDLDYGVYSINYYSRVTRPSWSCPIVSKFICDTNDLTFINTDCEISFSRYYYDSLINHFKPVFFCIGFVNKPEMKGFVIIYLNRVQNSYEFKKYSSQRIELSNQIDETTDSVFTSLSVKEIRSLFPKFKGNYKHLNIDSIVIDYQYLPDDYKFYNAINLFDFEIGKRWK